jgi:hypothetical protein
VYEEEEEGDAGKRIYEACTGVTLPNPKDRRLSLYRVCRK